MLRPVAWLDERQAAVGRRVEVSVPECGIEGLGEVLAVEPCPAVASGPGEVVTGTFRHESAEVVNVWVEGQAEPIGATANHPFWSDDRQAFVRADALRPGERLRGVEGPTRVVALIPRGGPEPVYNLEVRHAHVYHVTTAGLLVHNSCDTLGKAAKPGQAAKHHPWPMYLQGPVKQALLKLPAKLHDKYHSGLDKLGLARRYGAEYFRRLPPAVQAEKFDVFRKYTQEFDKIHGTGLWDAIKEIAAASP